MSFVAHRCRSNSPHSNSRRTNHGLSTHLIVRGRASLGFTLVELLVVIVLLSLMATMIVTAIRGTQRIARSAKTRAILATCNNTIEELYEQYKFRALAVEIPQTAVPGSRTGTEVGFEVLANEAARVRLMMVRDLQRMELPDRLSDIGPIDLDRIPGGGMYPSTLARSDPADLRAAANPVLLDAGGVVRATRDDNAQRRMFPVVWYGSGDDLPSRMAGYRDRLPGEFDFRNNSSRTNQGAECLYLIMSTAISRGSPAIDRIPGSAIGDTDEDGLLEILDGWGNPLAFIRWPVGFFGSDQSVDTDLPDDFDLFRTDFAYFSSATEALATDISQRRGRAPWSIRPLIMSAGSDGEFGIALNPWSDRNTELPAFSYQDSAYFWPVDTDHYGVTQVGGRNRGPGGDNQHAYPDPYLRQFVTDNGGSSFNGFLPGQLFDTEEALEVSADNISNYQLSEDVGR